MATKTNLPASVPVSTPRKVIRGEPIRAEHHNSLVDAITALSRRAGHSVPQYESARVVDNFPFKLYKVKGDESTSDKIALQPGTLDGVSPTISGVALDNTTVTANLTPPSNGTHIVALEIEFVPVTANDFQDPPEPYIAPGGTIGNLTVTQFTIDEWSNVTETHPTITNGSAVNGEYYQRIGFYEAEDENGIYRVTTVNNDTVRTSLQSVFCPPSAFNLLRQ